LGSLVPSLVMSLLDVTRIDFASPDSGFFSLVSTV
jgi:hypothetical protein